MKWNAKISTFYKIARAGNNQRTLPDRTAILLYQNKPDKRVKPLFIWLPAVKNGVQPGWFHSGLTICL